MTRLARRTSLLVAFYLLTSAATAYAECAWAMWSFHWVEDSGFEMYDVDLAYPTRQECQGELSTKATIMKQSGHSVKGGFPGSGEVISQKGKDHWRYFCLPDTVDPRGPKGK